MLMLSTLAVPSTATTHPLDEQLRSMYKHAEKMAAGRRGMKTGFIDVMTDQLPSWFRCTTYEAATAVDDSIGGIAAALLEDFMPHGAKQANYPGQPWRFQWTIHSSNRSALTFEYTRGADGPRHQVLLRNDASYQRAGKNPSKYRRCLLPWASADEPSAPRQLELRTVTDLAYDWMRYDFGVWVSAVSDRITHRVGAHGPPPVVVDPMCGSGWMPLLLRAQLGADARVVCSDVLEKSVDEARSNFEANGLEATFFVGDLFEPTRRAIAAGKLPRASVAYVYPPQDAYGEHAREDIDRMDQPLDAIFTPNRDDGLHFFRRVAAEAPAVLAADGVVWLGVDHRHVEGVRAIFAAHGWKVARETTPREGHTFYSPSVLLEASLRKREERGLLSHVKRAQRQDADEL